MKKIINGSRYDTEKAELIATASSGHFATDFAFWEESLFRTPRGRWFVAGEGGPMSRYSKSRGNETSGSEDIKPLTPDQARQWLEHYGTAEQVKQYFAAAVVDA